jgi:hypothetical protein
MAIFRADPRASFKVRLKDLYRARAWLSNLPTRISARLAVGTGDSMMKIIDAHEHDATDVNAQSGCLWCFARWRAPAYLRWSCRATEIPTAVRHGHVGSTLSSLCRARGFRRRPRRALRGSAGHRKFASASLKDHRSRFELGRFWAAGPTASSNPPESDRALLDRRVGSRSVSRSI